MSPPHTHSHRPLEYKYKYREMHLFISYKAAELKTTEKYGWAVFLT